jgi:hypothetical protein
MDVVFDYLSGYFKNNLFRVLTSNNLIATTTINTTVVDTIKNPSLLASTEFFLKV